MVKYCHKCRSIVVENAPKYTHGFLIVCEMCHNKMELRKAKKGNQTLPKFFRQAVKKKIATEFIYYCHIHCGDECQAIQIGNLQKREEFCKNCPELRFEEDNVDCEYRDTHADCCEKLVIK